MTSYDIDIGFLPDPAESHFRCVNVIWFNVAFVDRDHQFGEPFSTFYKISFQNMSVW